MSAYLGFQPTKNPLYYFVSYNNEDAFRIEPIVKALSYSGVALWYDYGIEYGDDWETTITERIQNAEGVVLFFTKGILQKKNSYVQKEFKMATQFFDRKVYVVILDEIGKDEIPTEKVSWWMDINEKQCINGYGGTDTQKLVETIADSLGIGHHEDKMNILIDKYNQLYLDGRIREAEAFLSEYLHGIALEEKAHLVACILFGKVQNARMNFSENVRKGQLPKPLITHIPEPKQSFYECSQVDVHGDIFTVGNDWVFHRGERGDAHVIWIWKNDELIHTIGGLVEAHDLRVFWDDHDNIIYVAYRSEEELSEDYKYVGSRETISITTIENPNEQVICTSFFDILGERVSNGGIIMYTRIAKEEYNDLAEMFIARGGHLHIN